MATISLHNHSTFSDGKNTIREMALAARAAGITAFGISDHFVLSPEPFGEQRFWSMAPNLLPQYIEEAMAVKREVETDDFHFRIGVEADYFPETIDTLKALLAGLPLDYVIGAAHYAADNFVLDRSNEDFQRLTPDQIHLLWESYIRRLHGICQAGYCNFVAHIDLCKKFGAFIPADLMDSMYAVLEEIAAAGLALEINTAGRDKPCQEFYPSPAIIRRAAELGIPFIIDADAHRTTEVDRHFAEARALLKAAGVRHTCEFTRRQKLLLPLT